MFAWLYINRVINRSITRSLTDSCHFKAIGLRADQHTLPHYTRLTSTRECVCVCVGLMFHTITAKHNTEKTKQKLNNIYYFMCSPVTEERTIKRFK